jgi:DNA-binding transcriptional LysR family regulator
MPKVRLAASRSTVVQYLPASLAEYLRQHPDTHIDLIERMSPDIPRTVIDGEADIGIYHATSAAPGVVSWSCHDDRVELIVPRGHPLAGRGPVSLEQALDFDFIGYFPRHSYEAFLDLAQRSLSRPLSVKFHVSDFEARCRMVHAGLGIAMLPDRVGRASIKALGLVQVPLKDEWARRQFFVCVRDDKAMSEAVTSLLRHFVQPGQAAKA